MRRFYSICILLLAAAVNAAAQGAQDPVRMVTFFPVPYVAYSQVQATNLAIGLKENCSLTLGNGQIQYQPLVFGNNSFGTILEHGTLRLTHQDAAETEPDFSINNGASTATISVGVFDPSSTSGSNLLFKQDVRIGAIQDNNNSDKELDSVHTTDLTTDQLMLFYKEFPACRQGNGEKYDGTIKWASHKLVGEGTPHTYLECDMRECAPEGTDGSSCPATCGNPPGPCCGMRTRSCVNGSWGNWDNSGCTPKPDSEELERKDCPNGDYARGGVHFGKIRKMRYNQCQGYIWNSTDRWEEVPGMACKQLQWQSDGISIDAKWNWITQTKVEAAKKYLNEQGIPNSRIFTGCSNYAPPLSDCTVGRAYACINENLLKGCHCAYHGASSNALCTHVCGSASLSRCVHIDINPATGAAAL